MAWQNYCLINDCCKNGMQNATTYEMTIAKMPWHGRIAAY